MFACEDKEKDCAGVEGGTAEEDICGVCNGDGTSCYGCTDSTACNFNPDATIYVPNSCLYDMIPDCNGECGGDAVEDCAGVCSGTAVEDNCGVCDSDTTNDCLQDCAGFWDDG